MAVRVQKLRIIKHVAADNSLFMYIKSCAFLFKSCKNKLQVCEILKKEKKRKNKILWYQTSQNKKKKRHTVIDADILKHSTCFKNTNMYVVYCIVLYSRLDLRKTSGYPLSTNVCICLFCVQSYSLALWHCLWLPSPWLHFLLYSTTSLKFDLMLRSLWLSYEDLWQLELKTLVG